MEERGIARLQSAYSSSSIHLYLVQPVCMGVWVEKGTGATFTSSLGRTVVQFSAVTPLADLNRTTLGELSNGQSGKISFPFVNHL